MLTFSHGCIEITQNKTMPVISIAGFFFQIIFFNYVSIYYICYVRYESSVLESTVASS
jgi:hypothetical protein